MTDINIPSELKFTHSNIGYQQAICNSARLVVNNANEVFAACVEGDISRLESLVYGVAALEEDLSAEIVDDDLVVFDRLITDIIPSMSELYGVSQEDILTDVKRAIDYYADMWIRNWLST